MDRLRTLASVALFSGLGLLTGCQPCSKTSVQESQIKGDLLWHSPSGDVTAEPWPFDGDRVPVSFAAGMFTLFFDVPELGPRALEVFDPDLEKSGPGAHPLEGLTAWVGPVETSSTSTGGVQSVSLKGTLDVRSVDRLSVDASFYLTDSGETGPRGNFDVVFSASTSEGQCPRKSLF